MCVCNWSPLLPPFRFLFCHSNILLILFPQTLAPSSSSSSYLLPTLLLLSHAPSLLLHISYYFHPSTFTSLRDHNGAATCPIFCFFFPPSFITFLPDNSPVLTGWSYYPLYGTSMLRGFYEILVPVDKMMELVSAVIPSRITASVGKYTMPWIIDRAVAALLLTNSWPVVKGAHNPEEYHC